jgi:hypothetical protein
VDKGDPRVEVTYTDPLGQKISDTEPSPGSIDGGSYQLTSSSQSPLETLRLDNPYPGSWKVTFTDPPGVPATVGLSVAWQGEVQLEFVNQQVGDPGHPYRLVVQPAVRSAPVPASALAGLRAEFAVTWPGGQVTRAEAALDAAGDFTATVLVPQVLQGLNGIARVTATAAAPSVQGQALGAFPVTPDGGITVNLNLRPGTTVVPGGTVTAIATVDSGQSRASIVFSLAGLGNGVDATLTQPSGAVAYGPGTSSFPVTITFSPDTRSGPALGTILWAPAGQGTLAPSDWLAIAPLDVDIAYQATTPFWLLWWFWPVIVAVVAACASLGFRRRDSRERIK